MLLGLLSWFAISLVLQLSLPEASASPVAGTQSPAVQDSLAAAATFDSVWSRIANTHWDPDMSGVDWEGARAELRPEALAATSMAELREVLTELLARLGDSHFQLIPSEAEPGVLGGAAAGSAGPGLEFGWIGDELLVTGVDPGGAAERAGIRSGWIVEAVGDTSIDSLAAQLATARLVGDGVGDMERWLPTLALGRTLGPDGSEAEVTLTDADGRTREIRLLRSPARGEVVEFGNLPPVRVEVEERGLSTPEGAAAGVIGLSAWFPAATPRLARAVDRFRVADGIVFDLRGNPGGVGGLVMGVGGHFLDEPMSLGTLRSRQGDLEFMVNPQVVAPDGRRVEPYDGPLAILVDAGSASTSEIFAGGLQALGRAVIIGQRTAGQALPAAVIPLPNGDRLMHAVADFTAPDGTRLEGVGVTPDIPVTLTREAVLREEDPVLARALRWIDDQ